MYFLNFDSPPPQANTEKQEKTHKTYIILEIIALIEETPSIKNSTNEE